MRLSKLVTSSAIGAAMLLGGVGAALSAPINLEGYSGPITIKFSDYESFSGSGITPGSQNFGVFNITSITTSAASTLGPIGTTIWTPGGANGFLSGVFNGITVENSTNTSAVSNTGGVFQIYNTASLFDPAQGLSGYTTGGCLVVGGLCYNGITNTGGANVLNFALTPGITSDPTTTLSSSFNSATLNSSTNGEAAGFANITGGTDAGAFVKQSLATQLPGVFADLSISDIFCGNGGTNQFCTGTPIGDWELLSQDPVKANIVPEPSTLALFGASLLGLGALIRRRKWHKA